MTPVSYSVPTERTSPIFARAFAKGCRGTVDTSGMLQPGPVALFGSLHRWALLQQAIRSKREWFYGDHGYFGRMEYYRVTRNAYQHDGTGSAGPERFQSFHRTVQPWRKTGQHILVCPNSAGYFKLFGLDVDRWLAEVTQRLRAFTDRPIKVRWKHHGGGTIERDLQDCWAVVAYSSAAALDALIAGVPVFVLADFAAAHRMGLSDLSRIETPRYPDDREQFLWNLASQQWTLDEISRGIAWRALTSQMVAHAS